jgi:hypothetical protein
MGMVLGEVGMEMEMEVDRFVMSITCTLESLLTGLHHSRISLSLSPSVIAPCKRG